MRLSLWCKVSKIRVGQEIKNGAFFTLVRQFCTIFTPDMTTREATNTFKRRLHGVWPDHELQQMMRIILEDVMHYTPVDAVIHEHDELPDFFEAKLSGIIERLLRHEPLQYVLGEARFHGLRFKVTPAVLIPRPETEMLVDMVADANPQPDLRVLDVGTGSGCIAIALARTLKWPQVTATDVSAQALAVARQNAEALKATNVRLVQQDILQTEPPRKPEYDVVVSNPPYIFQSERAGMEANVLDYEPGTALWVPDDDPLLYYRTIARYAAAALVPGGRLYFEINRAQGSATAALLGSLGYTGVNVTRDQFGNERFATAVRPE